MGHVVVAMLIASVRYVMGLPALNEGYFARPFYDPQRFSLDRLSAGTASAITADPSGGFLICAYIWWSLGVHSEVAGAIWLAISLVFGAWRTKGFRRGLVRFEAPAE